MPEFTDQLGNKIHLENIPKRVISLVPSQSEFLWDIGLHHELVGITKFCIHPKEMFTTIERVGGTKQLDLDKIRRLKPDLIIGNKEENEKEQIEILQKEFPVWLSDIYSFEDAGHMMLSLGALLNKQKESQRMVDTLTVSLSRIKNVFQKQSLVYFIWNKPYLGAASGTFIDHVIQHIGFKNSLKYFQRYPQLDENTLQELNPSICFLSSEPFPFNEKHLKELQVILPKSKIKLVNGEMFSWYGSRLLKLEVYVTRLKKELRNS